MLKEDQVVELLCRCEELCGERLTQARGNLKHPKTRSEAIWELIGIEEFASHLPVVHEPEGASRPDLLITLSGLEVAIEFTFLTSKHWENDRKRDQARQLIREVLLKESVSLEHIRTYCKGKKTTNGYFQNLPALHQKKEITKNKNLKVFIKAIKTKPNLDMQVRLEPYDIDVVYEPSKSPSNFSSGNIVEGYNWDVTQNAVYRKIKDKHRQHQLKTPLFVCIGGDDSSPIAPRFSDRTIQDRAVFGAFSKFRNVSGVVLSKLEWPLDVSGMRPVMQYAVYKNEHARYPLSADFWTMLKSINFNRWKYTFSLRKWDQNSMDERSSLGGNLQVQEVPDGKSIVSLPAQLVLDALQGKSHIYTEYRAKEGGFPQTFFDLGWEIEDVNFRPSNIEKGGDDFVEFTLIRRKKRVFKN